MSTKKTQDFFQRETTTCSYVIRLLDNYDIPVYASVDKGVDSLKQAYDEYESMLVVVADFDERLPANPYTVLYAALKCYKQHYYRGKCDRLSEKTCELYATYESLINEMITDVCGRDASKYTRRRVMPLSMMMSLIRRILEAWDTLELTKHGKRALAPLRAAGINIDDWKKAWMTIATSDLRPYITYNDNPVPVQGKKVYDALIDKFGREAPEHKEEPKAEEPSKGIQCVEVQCITDHSPVDDMLGPRTHHNIVGEATIVYTLQFDAPEESLKAAVTMLNLRKRVDVTTCDVLHNMLTIGLTGKIVDGYPAADSVATEAFRAMNMKIDRIYDSLVSMLQFAARQLEPADAYDSAAKTC